MKNITHYKNSKIWWYKDCMQIFISDHYAIRYGYEDIHDPEIFNHMLQIGKVVIAW